MNDQDKLASKANDEPLFVLRYLPYKRIIPAIALIFCIIFFGLATFVVPGIKFSVKPIGFVAFFLFLFRLVDLLLFQEIRLYKDKIVKVWHLIGAREIKLEDAQLRSFTSPTLGVSGKSIFSQDASETWGWVLRVFLLRGISYQEHLADPEDVKELNSLLADISGRKAEDFERTGTISRLVSKGDA